MVTECPNREQMIGRFLSCMTNSENSYEAAEVGEAIADCQGMPDIPSQILCIATKLSGMNGGDPPTERIKNAIEQVRDCWEQAGECITRKDYWVTCHIVSCRGYTILDTTWK